MGPVFEWDPIKAERNRAKHGVSIDEAATVFGDPFGQIVEDPRHSEGERRYVLLGMSSQKRLLAVMYTERGEKGTINQCEEVHQAGASRV